MTEVNAEMKTQDKAMEDRGKILRTTLIGIMNDYYIRRFFQGNILCIQCVLCVIMGDPGLIAKDVKA